MDESLLFAVTLVDMPYGETRESCTFVNTERFLLKHEVYSSNPEQRRLECHQGYCDGKCLVGQT